MKHRIKTLLGLWGLFFLNATLASNLCLHKECSRSPDADVSCRPVERVLPFFEVNGVDVNVTASSMADDITYNISTGCVPAEDYLYEGENHFLYEVHFVGGDGKLDQGWLTHETWAQIDGRKYPICRIDFVAGGDNSHGDSCERGIYLSLEEIDPNLYEQLRHALDEMSELLNQVEEFDTDLQQEVIDVNRTLESLAHNDFDRIQEADLVRVEAALNQYRALRMSLNDLRAQVVQLRQQADERLDELATLVDNIMQVEGITETDFDTQHPLAIPVLDIPQLVVDYSFTPENNFYDVYADHAIHVMEGHYSQGDYNAFLNDVDAWLTTVNHLRMNLDSETYTSPSEWQVFNAALARVDHYIFGNGTQVGKLTRDLWFSDSPVEQHQRDAIGVIKENFAEEGSIIESELKTWRGEHLTPEQIAMLQTLAAIGNGIKQMLSEGGDALRASSNVVTGAAIAVKEGVKCTATVLALGDFADLYEIVWGKNICTGEPLSVSERAFTSLGMVALNGSFWRGFGSSMGLISDAKVIAQINARIADAANKWRFNRTEIDEFKADFNRYLCPLSYILAECTAPDFADKLKLLLEDKDIEVFSKVELKQAVKHGKITKEDMLAWRRSREFADFAYDLYKTRKKADGQSYWEFNQWFNNYTLNLERVGRSREIELAYKDKLGWGRHQMTPDLTLPDGSKRRFDIGDEKSKPPRGVEVKSGYVCRSAEVLKQIEADKFYKKNGWDIEWHFDGMPSKPLVKELESAGFLITFRDPSLDPR